VLVNPAIVCCSWCDREKRGVVGGQSVVSENVDLPPHALSDDTSISSCDVQTVVEAIYRNSAQLNRSD
jgi:hypothetical protein